MDRRFLRIWVGQVLSRFGTTVSAFGAAVWVFLETDSLMWLAVLSMMAALPSVLAAPLTGLVDRYDRRTVMLAADTGAAIVTAVIVVVWLVTDLEPWHLVVAAFVSEFIGSFQGPAYEAAVPSLVEDPEDLGRANGLVQLGPGLATVAAPGAAGILLAVGGLGAIFIVDLVSFAIAVVTVLATPFSASAVADEDDRMRLRDAAVWVRRQAPGIGALILAMAATNLVLSAFNVAIVARGTDLGGEAGAGLAPTLGGLGMVVVGLAIGTKGIPVRRMRALMYVMFAYGGLSIVAVVRPWLTLFVIGIGLAVSTVSLAQAIVSTTFHERVPGAMQGRVFGLRNAIGRGTAPIGALAAGPIAAWSVSGTIAGAGVVLIVVGVYLGTAGLVRPLDRAPERGATA